MWILSAEITEDELINLRSYNPLRQSYACIYVGNLAIMGSDNGLSPGRHQAIIWTNAGILLIALPGTNFGEILIEIPTFSFKKLRLKMSSEKWQPFCLGFIVNLYLNRHPSRNGKFVINVTRRAVDLNLPKKGRSQSWVSCKRVVCILHM